MASRSDLATAVDNTILSGGRRTTAENVRATIDLFIDSALNIDDDADVAGGYLAIDMSGIVDISFIKSATPSGLFLQDDGTWAAAGGGAGTLFATLSLGNNTGGLSIVSPDLSSQLNIVDTQALMGYYGASISGEVYASLSGSGMNFLDSGSGNGGTIFILDTDFTMTHSVLMQINTPIYQWTSDNGGFTESWIYGDNTNVYLAFDVNTLSIDASQMDLDHSAQIRFSGGLGGGLISDDNAYIYSQNGGFFVSEGFLVTARHMQIKIAETDIVHDVLIKIDTPIVELTQGLLVDVGGTNKLNLLGEARLTYNDGGANTGNRVVASFGVSDYWTDGTTQGYIQLYATEGRFIWSGSGAQGTMQINNFSFGLYHDLGIVFDAPYYQFTDLTADTVPYLDVAKKLISSAVTPTELGYISGLTSNAQAQINALSGGISSWKDNCFVATTANITLSGEQTIDGQLTSASRVLVWKNTNPVENGIWVSAAGAWTRATDFDNNTDKISSAATVVQKGATYADHEFICSSDAPVVVGTDPINFIDYYATYLGTANRITVTGNVINISASYDALWQPIDADLTTIAGLSPSNDDFLQRKAGAWANRTVAQVQTDLGVFAEKYTLAATFDGQGGVISVNSQATMIVPFTGTIVGWDLYETSSTPVSSSIVIDGWKDTYTNYPPTVADTIWGTKPALSAAIKNQATGLAIAVTAGDVMKLNIDSVTSALKAKLIFHIVRTA